MTEPVESLEDLQNSEETQANENSKSLTKAKKPRSEKQIANTIAMRERKKEKDEIKKKEREEEELRKKDQEEKLKEKLTEKIVEKAMKIKSKRDDVIKPKVSKKELLKLLDEVDDDDDKETKVSLKLPFLGREGDIPEKPKLTREKEVKLPIPGRKIIFI